MSLKVSLIITLLTTSLLVCPSFLRGQITGGSMGNGVEPSTMDTLKDQADKTPQKWQYNEQFTVWKTTKFLNDTTHYRDTSISYFHRFKTDQLFYKDLGNLGSPAKSLLFDIDRRVGPTLGYQLFKIYEFDIDSLTNFKVKKPYSVFDYHMGPQLEQHVDLLVTQNFKPWWNFTFQYKKINSPGMYAIQRVNSDYAYLHTNYHTPNLRYSAYLSAVINNSQHDENGGIVSDTFLTNPNYSPALIPVNYTSANTGNRRSNIGMRFRNLAVQYHHAYTLGKLDTLYNDDSSKHDLQLNERFCIEHRIKYALEQYRYRDLNPFINNYLPYHIDSIPMTTTELQSNQGQTYLENEVGLTGLIGKMGKKLLLNAALGFRQDQFNTYTIQWPDTMSDRKRLQNLDKRSFSSVFVKGKVSSTNADDYAWKYTADVLSYINGQYAGDLTLRGVLSKRLQNDWLAIQIEGGQIIQSAHYNELLYQNALLKKDFDANKKETITHIKGALLSPKFHLNIGVENKFIANYVYLDDAWEFQQYGTVLNVMHFWLTKQFRKGILIAQVEGHWQVFPKSAPINVPQGVVRGTIGVEGYLFKKALYVSTGLEGSYFTEYKPYGYSPILTRYYTQNVSSFDNLPIANVYLNMRIKRMRLFLIGGHLTQLFNKPIMNYPSYPLQDALFRFGFSWELVN